MARIEPFPAIRYTSSEVSHLIAPPYDILSADDKKTLLAKDDHNIVALDLPHVPPKSAGPNEVYDRAAGEMTSWLDIRCLARDPLPAIYAYHQTYKHMGKAHVRKMFFARLRLEPFSEGSVFAHEQTFGGPKEDRLKLTIATRCNLSPIFGLYPDPTNMIVSLLDDVVDREPDQSGVLEGISNQLWVVTDTDLIDTVRTQMKDKPVFIADGHHRYGTALMYRDREIEQTSRPSEDSPIHFVLAVFCSMEDPGALVQPYFRSLTAVKGFTVEAAKAATEKDMTWTVVPKPASAEEWSRRLASASTSALGLYFANENVCAMVTPKDEDMLARYEPKRHPAWRKLAYSIFHRYLLDEVIRPQFLKGKEPTVHYHKNMQEAISDAREEQGMVVLMPAVTMAQLREVCLAGELMPQKSTYFYPKLATGLVINPLY